MLLQVLVDVMPSGLLDVRREHRLLGRLHGTQLPRLLLLCPRDSHLAGLQRQYECFVLGMHLLHDRLLLCLLLLELQLQLHVLCLRRLRPRLLHQQLLHKLLWSR